MPSAGVIVFGGYGTFGTHIVRELATTGLAVTIAGRDRQRAEQAASMLGQRTRGIMANVTDPAGCRDAIVGHRVAVNAAGPFSAFAGTLLDACLATGCHYVDIADDRAYVAGVRARASEFQAQGLCAAYGCSSLPGISGAVASVLHDELLHKGRHSAVDHARITLFIGNRNPKGAGAVRSAAETVGKVIEAPQGPVVGFTDRQRVPLYPPFGSRPTLNFSSPDYDLIPAQLAIRSVAVKVGFELPGVTAMFGLAARYWPTLGRALIPKLVPCSGLLGWYGSSGGQVMVELYSDGERVCQGALVATADGQRLAALPAVYAAHRLCQHEPTTPGAMTAYELLGARHLVDRLVADGYEFKTN